MTIHDIHRDKLWLKIKVTTKLTPYILKTH